MILWPTTLASEPSADVDKKPNICPKPPTAFRGSDGGVPRLHCARAPGEAAEAPGAWISALGRVFAVGVPISPMQHNPTCINPRRSTIAQLPTQVSSPLLSPTIPIYIPSPTPRPPPPPPKSSVPPPPTLALQRSLSKTTSKDFSTDDATAYVAFAVPCEPIDTPGPPLQPGLSKSKSGEFSPYPHLADATQGACWLSSIAFLTVEVSSSIHIPTPSPNPLANSRPAPLAAANPSRAPHLVRRSSAETKKTLHNRGHPVRGDTQSEEVVLELLGEPVDAPGSALQRDISKSNSREFAPLADMEAKQGSYEEADAEAEISDI
ncbi:hypothetical protein DFH09DRAFT_1360053 [Mycena vulgaris]|nr:hypothetical protein DFH09DRAFT_1360053 [Mycena vulgaris]